MPLGVRSGPFSNIRTRWTVISQTGRDGFCLYALTTTTASISIMVGRLQLHDGPAARRALRGRQGSQTLLSLRCVLDEALGFGQLHQIPDVSCHLIKASGRPYRLIHPTVVEWGGAGRPARVLEHVIR